MKPPPAARPRMICNRTWVVPNRNTIGLVAVLIGMGYAGLTQGNGAAYLLCFVFAAVALVSTLHAWANLQGIEIEADPVRAAFAGDELAITMRVRSTRHRTHLGIRIRAAAGGSEVTFARVSPQGTVEGAMTANAARRGVFPGVTVLIESNYPLGFFTARTRVELSAPHHVYPEPRGDRPLPVTPRSAGSGSGGTRPGGDDFGGVRAWRVGESQRHIDWKAVARGQPLLIKQWAGDTNATAVLTWNSAPHLIPEARLGQLARWVIEAERSGRLYALELPGVALPPGRGDAHFHASLRRLAEFTPPPA